MKSSAIRAHRQMTSKPQNGRGKQREIPWRREPVVQRQGHRVPGLQAEPREQGRQKLDNQ